VVVGPTCQPFSLLFLSPSTSPLSCPRRHARQFLLGNSAPDALSALASFAAGGGGGAAAVGLNGVLGEAMFVSAVVLGVVTLRVAGHGVAVDRASFFHDAGFLLQALAAVAVVLAPFSPPAADDPEREQGAVEQADRGDRGHARPQSSCPSSGTTAPRGTRSLPSSSATSPASRWASSQQGDAGDAAALTGSTRHGTARHGTRRGERAERRRWRLGLPCLASSAPDPVALRGAPPPHRALPSPHRRHLNRARAPRHGLCSARAPPPPPSSAGAAAHTCGAPHPPRAASKEAWRGTEGPEKPAEARRGREQGRTRATVGAPRLSGLPEPQRKLTLLLRAASALPLRRRH